MNVNDLNVEGVYGFVKEKFGNHIASNFKGEGCFQILNLEFFLFR